MSAKKDDPDLFGVKIIRELERRESFTPDFSDMRMYEYIPLFIYDPRLKQKGDLNYLLRPGVSKYLGKAISVINRYVVYDEASVLKPKFFAEETKTLGNNPNHLFNSHLYGEVYAIPPIVLLDIDEYMCNNDLYIRERRNFFLRDQEAPVKTGTSRPSLGCQVYIGKPEILIKMSKNKRHVIKDHISNKWIWG